MSHEFWVLLPFTLLFAYNYIAERRFSNKLYEEVKDRQRRYETALSDAERRGKEIDALRHKLEGIHNMTKNNHI